MKNPFYFWAILFFQVFLGNLLISELSPISPQSPSLCDSRFGMSSTFIVFVCTRLICGRLQVSESRPRVDRGPEIDLEQPERRTDGLESALVAAIPTMKFHRDAFSSVEDAQCSICLGEYQEKEVLRIMPKCGHNFHLYCIDIWLAKQSTCPVCRLPLKDSSDRKCARLVSFNVVSYDDNDAGNSMEHSIGNGSNQYHSTDNQHLETQDPIWLRIRA